MRYLVVATIKASAYLKELLGLGKKSKDNKRIYVNHFRLKAVQLQMFDDDQ